MNKKAVLTQLKEFLKPTKWKTRTFILLYFLAFFLIVVGSLSIFSCLFNSADIDIASSCIETPASQTAFRLADFLWLPQYVTNDFLIFIVLDAIYLYMLAAIIVYVAGKTIQPKKKISKPYKR